MGLLSLAAALLAAAACSPGPAAPKGEPEMKSRPKPECATCDTPALPVSALPASEEAWRKKLTEEQFYILRQRGTERPNSGKYLHHKEDGLYACGGCGQALYDSKTKYDSCEWPSFWQALPGAVGTDNGGGAVEVHCARCKGHLGHIFDDGPAPTFKRH